MDDIAAYDVRNSGELVYGPKMVYVSYVFSVIDLSHHFPCVHIASLGEGLGDPR